MNIASRRAAGPGRRFTRIVRCERKNRRRSHLPLVRRWSPQVPPIRNEAELYRAVDLDFIPPELRENCGEFEAAENHSLPRLIEKENLRGTFHCHTIASDGHNTLEEMAQPRRRLASNISASPSTATARSRRTVSTKQNCARKSRRFEIE